MNHERRIEALEESSGMHTEEAIINICSNVNDRTCDSPEEQLEQQRAAGIKRIVIRKYCGNCNEHCTRRRNGNEPEKQN
ncbi:MAG: hypothetical protein M0R70_05755 [Nitrospirae bacterium]|nr:hypothetical protein [Nitrospirota bacterium]